MPPKVYPKSAYHYFSIANKPALLRDYPVIDPDDHAAITRRAIHITIQLGHLWKLTPPNLRLYYLPSTNYRMPL